MDTVSVRNHAGTNEPHGWVGLRFQQQLGGQPNDILLHINLRDPTNLLQQEAIGILGVNLLYAAFYQLVTGDHFLECLMQDVESRIEIDYVDLRGPAFETETWDRRGLLVQLVCKGFAGAVCFPSSGAPVPPTEAIHKNALVLAPGYFVHMDPSHAEIHTHMLASGIRQLQAEIGETKTTPRGFFCLTLEQSDPKEPPPQVSDLLHRIDALRSRGGDVLLFREQELYAITDFVNRYTEELVRFVVGLSIVIRAFRRSLQQAGRRLSRGSISPARTKRPHLCLSDDRGRPERHDPEDFNYRLGMGRDRRMGVRPPVTPRAAAGAPVRLCPGLQFSRPDRRGREGHEQQTKVNLSRGRAHHFSCAPGNLLDAVNEHFCDERITRLRIEHCVIQVVLWPVQLKVSLDESGAIPVNRVNVRDCLVLRCSSGDQSVDLKVSRRVEERPENILAIAKKKLRAPANDHAWAAGERVIDCLFGDGGDPARIEHFQPIRWRQAALECSSEKRLEDAINRRITFPFPLRDHLRRAVGQPRDLLGQFVVPQLPTQKLGQPGGDFRAAAAEFPFDRYGLNHHDNT